MADTIQCPYCCGHADLVKNCRACNGAGVIGMHDAPPSAAVLAPDSPMAPARPVLFVQVSAFLAADGLAVIVALDMAGHVWHYQTERWTMIESPAEPA